MLNISHKTPLTFVKGSNWYSESSSNTTRLQPFELAKNDFNDVLSSRNLTFLFGSGCSSHRDINDVEQGIPTMAPLAQGILAVGNENVAEQYGLTPEVKSSLLNVLGIDLTSEEYAWNLERLMEVLFGFQFALANTASEPLRTAKPSLNSAIEGIKRYVFDACQQGQSQPTADTVLSLYQTFYRKLSQRSRSLPRPTIATTNYDLFNEIAMDRIGVPYINGFLGSIEKRFNPSSFRYTIAQRLDLASQRWTSLDNLVYFLKLHGSLNWHSVDTGLFPVEERPLSEVVMVKRC